MHPWFAPLVSKPRLKALGIGFGVALLLANLPWQSGFLSLFWRVGVMAAVAALTFNALEHWPRRLPKRLPRWILQMGVTTLLIPTVMFLIYVQATLPGAPPFWRVQDRLGGFAMLCFIGVMVSTWTVLIGLVVQREAEVREQALAFALERSELERQALDARLRLVQAQVEPHFIFNTLANVRALVESGSPRASTVLGSLIAYLRAALPRLDNTRPPLAQEVELVQAYLELMQMRMPDRLRYRLDIAPDALGLHCPPLSLMTLVENAVRHGLDPSEEGGEIAISASVESERLRLRVQDSGVGWRATSSAGTGLAGLRERLKLSFGADAFLRISEVPPHGVLAEVELPAQDA